MPKMARIKNDKMESGIDLKWILIKIDIWDWVTKNIKE